MPASKDPKKKYFYANYVGGTAKEALIIGAFNLEHAKERAIALLCVKPSRVICHEYTKKAQEDHAAALAAESEAA